MPEIDYFINAREVCKQVGLSRISIYRRMNEGRFPPGRKLSGNVVRWRQSEISAWMAEQPFNDVTQKAGCRADSSQFPHDL